MSEKFTGHGIVGPMAAPGPADFYGCLTPKIFPPKNTPHFGFENRFFAIFKAEVREKAAFPKRRPQRRRFGSGEKRQVGAILTKMTIFSKENAFCIDDFFMGAMQPKIANLKRETWLCWGPKIFNI